MRYVLLLLLLVMFVPGNTSFAQFAFTFGSQGQEYGKASTIDRDTSYINTSLFQNTINVNPVGVTNLTAPGTPTQIAVTKYSKNGALLWAFHVGGTSTSDGPHGVGCDSLGNIYMTGYFGSTAVNGPQSANFNPSGAGTITSQGNEDCFVTKYDKNGNFHWAFGLGNIGSNTQERSWDIIVEPSGSFYVAGGFHGTMNFNPLGTPLTYSLQDTLAGLFVAKYNSEGHCLWALPIQAQCTNVFTEAYATCDFDTLGNLYVAGNFRGENVNFNPLGQQTVLSSSGLTDIFLAKYNAGTGALIWVKKIGGTSAEIASPGALRCDRNGYPYFTGRLSGVGSVDFDPGSGTVNISASALFLATYDRDGNLRYATGMNSGGGDGGHRVAFDKFNDVYLSGWMNGTATFGSIVKTAFSPTSDVFLAKYNNSLTTCYWVHNFGGEGSSGNNICAGLSVDQNDNAYITGQIYGINADVDPSPAQQFLSSTGQNDCFIVKYTSEGKIWSPTTAISTEEKIVPSGFSLLQNYPNPFNPLTTIRFTVPEQHHIRLTVYNVLGEQVTVLVDEVKNKGEHMAVFDAAGTPTGIYMYRLQIGENSLIKKMEYLK